MNKVLPRSIELIPTLPPVLLPSFLQGICRKTWFLPSLVQEIVSFRLRYINPRFFISITTETKNKPRTKVKTSLDPIQTPFYFVL